MPTRKRPRGYLSRLTARHWSWIHFKASLGLGWGTAILFVTPVSVSENVTSESIYVWAFGTIIGALISLAGIFMTVANSQKIKMYGLAAEIVGLVLLAGGPLQYLFVQFGYVIEGEFVVRYALIWFVYSLLAAVIVRFIQIIPVFINEVVAIQAEKEAIQDDNGDS